MQMYDLWLKQNLNSCRSKLIDCLFSITFDKRSFEILTLRSLFLTNIFSNLIRFAEKDYIRGAKPVTFELCNRGSFDYSSE